MNEMPKLISIKKAAETLGVSTVTMYELANADNFPATVRVNGSRGKKMYRIHEGKFIKWIESGGMQAG